MNGTHWLLLGGPGHGEVHEVFFSKKVLWEHKGKDYLYTPQVYNDEATGKSYMLGIWQPDYEELTWLIKSRKLLPIVWDNSLKPDLPPLRLE